jgi:hypothetical protein
MFVNYKINAHTLSGATTATTINIPINIDYQIVDNSELIETKFVDIEVQKAVNPILDYYKVRYNVSFLDGNFIQNPTYYSTIGFNDQDIKFERSNFKESFLSLQFFDTDNALTQTLMSEIDIYSNLSQDSYYSSGTPRTVGIAGQVKPASQIPVRFTLSNPVLVKRGFYEGYHIYSYKDDIAIGAPKYLYMKATYFNAKSGKSTNLCSIGSPLTIDSLVNKLYTKYVLIRTSTGFYYQLDNTYSSNIVYTTNATNQNNKDVTINLYQIQVV